MYGTFVMNNCRETVVSNAIESVELTLGDGSSKLYVSLTPELAAALLVDLQMTLASRM